MTETVLEFNRLSKCFGAKRVLDEVTGTVHTGDVIGLLGLNGAGKTTLLETALGFALPDGGTASVFGHDSVRQFDTGTKQRIGFVPQSDELLEGFTGRRYLDLVAGFYPRWNHELSKRLTAEWDIPMHSRISTLSVGQRQKLSIVAALGHEPELIILDEPVASLDPVARRQFLRELVDIASARTRSIVFSTHIVSDLERVASRVWLLKNGRMAVDTELDTLKEKCVRIHLPPGMDVPAPFRGDRLIHSRLEYNTNIIVFSQWNEAEHTRLEQACGTTLAPEYLSLEDIFLELHA